MTNAPYRPPARYAPPLVLRTRADLREHVDFYKAIQNGHGYGDLERWFTRPDEFGRKASTKSIAKKMNRDRRTVAKWRRVWEADA